MKQHLLPYAHYLVTGTVPRYFSDQYGTTVLLKLQWLCYEDFKLFYFTFFYQIMLNVFLNFQSYALLYK